MTPSLSGVPTKIWISIISTLAVATLGYYLYTQYTLRGEMITSLEASVAHYKQAADANANLANANADEYLKAMKNHQDTLTLLKETQDQIKASEQEALVQENQTNVQIDQLPKDSFESRCYNMDVNLN